MDPVTIEKLQAMKRYKRKGFLHRIISFLTSLVSLGLFLSCPLWLPKLYSFLRYFFLVCIPNTREVLLGSKCLFVVCNLIVVLLLRESKARGGAPDIYEEYVRRNKSMARNVVEKDRKEEVKGDGGDHDKDAPYYMEGANEEDDQVEEEEEKGEEMEGDDESGILTEELNKKVEDFIARVNRQRRLEARMLCWE